VRIKHRKRRAKFHNRFANTSACRKPFNGGLNTSFIHGRFFTDSWESKAHPPCLFSFQKRLFGKAPVNEAAKTPAQQRKQNAAKQRESGSPLFTKHSPINALIFKEMSGI
jgi:hypothetical protein